ncbi:MAG: hypothetical protein VX737_06115 [Pseudomonadota bacterium]|nr:hypothetical protein [Pseudomonadota bacterium]
MVDKLPHDIRENKRAYREMIDRLVRFMKGEDFVSYVSKVHKDIDYEKIASRLEEQSEKLKSHKQGIVEFYFNCQQINTEILTKIVGSIATHTVETTTKIPVINEISWVIDQMVMVTLKIGEWIAMNISKLLPKIEETKPIPGEKRSIKQHLLDWYQNNLKNSLQEMQDTVDSLKAKHGKHGSEIQLSTLACLVKMVAILINCQSRIITGVITKSAEMSGHVLNDVLKQIKIPEIVKDLSGMIRSLMENIFSFPMEQEATVLKAWDVMGNKLQTYIDECNNNHNHDHSPSGLNPR